MYNNSQYPSLDYSIEAWDWYTRYLGRPSSYDIDELRRMYQYIQEQIDNDINKIYR